MQRYSIITLAAIALFFASCEKCKRCSYTYEVTTIEQTPNGEVENTTEVSGIISKENGEGFGEECIKNDESFTIEQAYQNKKDTTTLDNFDYTCENI